MLATVLGTPLRAVDLAGVDLQGAPTDATQALQLLASVWSLLEAEAVARHHLTPTAEEVEATAWAMGRIHAGQAEMLRREVASAREGLATAADAQQRDALQQRVAMLEQALQAQQREHGTLQLEAARRMVSRWKFNRWIHREYNGAAVWQQFNIEPVEGYLRWLEQAEVMGKLTIHDPELRRAFWTTVRPQLEVRHAAAPGTGFEYPWWMEQLAHLPDIIAAEDAAALHHDPEDPAMGRYDWGPVVMFDEGLYKLWWVRWGGTNETRFPYVGALPDGATHAFSYPDRGDRIYYAESRDGKTWQLSGPDYVGAPETFGPDAEGPLMVMGPAEAEGERMHVGTPSVIKVDGVYYMYYEAAGEFALDYDAAGQPTVGGEYHNQIFLATSSDGKVWHKHPCNEAPQPIVTTPDANKEPGRRRYGNGQPSVYFRDGRFVMHYVDSQSCPGDYVVRLEADNPLFVNAATATFSWTPRAPEECIPAGAVARFAQMDVKYLGDTVYLLRPAYTTGNLGVMAARGGSFLADRDAHLPRDVMPQILVRDPRGFGYLERLFPRFLSEPTGEIRVENGRVTLYYGSGLGWKHLAYTWDLQRSTVSLDALREATK